MRTQNLMLNQILASVGVNVPLYIPDVPAIASLTKISTTSASNETHPPTYEHLHRPLITQNQSKNKLVPYKKYLMSILSMVNSNLQLGRQKLVQVFHFWFGEGALSLYNNFKPLRKTDEN